MEGGEEEGEAREEARVVGGWRNESSWEVFRAGSVGAGNRCSGGKQPPAHVRPRESSKPQLVGVFATPFYFTGAGGLVSESQAHTSVSASLGAEKSVDICRFDTQFELPAWRRCIRLPDRSRRGGSLDLFVSADGAFG